MRSHFTLLLILILASPLLAAPAEPKPAGPVEAKTFKLASSAFDFAYDADSDTLAAVHPDKDELLLFTKIAGDEPKPVTVKTGKQPIAVVFKRVGKKAFWVVANYGSSSLTIVNAETNEPADIEIAVSRPAALAPTIAAEDPHIVYFGSFNKDGFVEGRAGRIVLGDKITDEATFEHGLGQVGIGDGAMSPDGKRLVTRSALPPYSLSVYELQGPTADRKTLAGRLLRRENEGGTAHSPLVDPAGSFVVTDKRVWSPSLDRELSKLPVPALALSATRPIVYGIADGRLSASSSNSWKTVGKSAPVTVEPANKRLSPAKFGGFGFREWAYRTRVFERGEKLLVCSGAAVNVVPVALLDLPDEPFVSAKVDGSTDVTVDKLATLRLTPREKGTKIEVVEGPKWLSLKDGSLTGTPTEAGTFPVKLRLSVGTTERLDEFTLTARRPSVQLPFEPGVVVVSPDGKTALATGLETTVRPGMVEQVTRLALIDLAGPSLIAERRLPGTIRTATLDAKQVYVVQGTDDTLQILKLKDLSDVKKVFTPGRLSTLVPAGDFLFLQSTGNALSVLKADDLSVANVSDVGNGTHLLAKGDAGQRAAPVRVGDGWWFDGTLYDADLKKVRAVSRTAGILTIAGPVGPFVPNPGIPGPRDLTASPTPWGATLSGNAIQYGRRNVTLAQGNGPNTSVASALLADKPAAVTLRATSGLPNAAKPVPQKVELLFHELVGGTVAQEMTLLDEPANPLGRTFGPDRLTRVVTAPGRIVAWTGDRVFSIATPELPAEKFAPPLHFALERPVIVAGFEDKEGPAVPKAIGGKEPVEYSLRSGPGGMALDAKGGKLQLKGDALVSAFADQFLRQGVSGLVRPVRPGGATPDAVLDEYIKSVESRYETLTGKKPTGVPVWLAVGITARDKELQTADTEIGFLMELPIDAVKSRLKDPTRVPVVPNPMPPDSNAAQRMADLERKVEKLTEQLDKMSKQVEELNRRLKEKDAPK